LKRDSLRQQQSIRASKNASKESKGLHRDEAEQDMIDLVVSEPFKLDNPGFLATFHSDQEVTQLVNQKELNQILYIMCGDIALDQNSREIIDDANAEAYTSDMELVHTKPYIVPAALVNEMIGGTLFKQIYKIHCSEIFDIGRDNCQQDVA